MKLADLKAKGACIDPAPVRKAITWKHTDESSGEEITDKFDVWVTRLSFGVVDHLSRINSTDRSSNAELIASSVRLGENAEERLSYEIAYSLNPSLALELVRAVAEVNRLSETEDSGSGPKD